MRSFVFPLLFCLLIVLGSVLTACGSRKCECGVGDVSYVSYENDRLVQVTRKHVCVPCPETKSDFEVK